ncbi:hypothetical protein [Sphingosinicella terrae]|uniref:hypothetical protein n=1 Tax=Sphingosinicella terrae TaxID=2172047 RepID=UPI000E0DA26B|nr:hypothetical protein [Sphingosinicella terrae]
MASTFHDRAAGEFDYRAAWRRDDAAIEADAIHFWRRLGILPEGVTPEARAKELVAVAYRDGGLVAVATASVVRLEFLRARFAMLRAAVDPDFRRSRAALGLALFTRDLLERWSYAHPKEGVAGLGAIIEAPELAAHRKEPYWPATRLGLVGYTADGHQIRVSWFDQFRLD